MNIRKLLTRGLAASLICTMLVPTAGCSLKEKVSSTAQTMISTIFTIDSDKCTEQEAKVILLNYQKKYSSLYSIDVWAYEASKGNVDVSDDGSADIEEDSDSLQSYIKELTLAQLARVFTMDAIAANQEIELNDEEHALAKQAAAQFYSGLNAEEIAYIDIDEEGITALYERYALAEKVYDTITANVEQEVSDNEARIAIAAQIFTTDETKAAEAYQALQSGTAFDTVAGTYNESDIYKLNVNRDTLPANLVDSIFNLQEKTYSEVLSADDGYYIFYCVSPFDPDLTEAHKADVLKDRKEKAVSDIYDNYCDSLSSTLHSKNWSRVKVNSSLSLEGDSFLTVYNQYFHGSSEMTEE